MHGKRDDGSHVVDAVLKRDPALRLPPGFDQCLSDPSYVRAPPAHANGLTRALTASKYSLLHCRDVVSPCLRSPRCFLPEHLDVSKVDETRTCQGNCSGQPSLEKNQRNPGHICPEHPEGRHKRTCVLVLFSLASKHSPLHLREVVRSQEVEEHCVRFETSNTLTTRSTFLVRRAGKTLRSTTSSLKRLFRLYRKSRRDPAGFMLTRRCLPRAEGPR